MKEDLRYLERLLVEEEEPVEHPSVDMLAAFSDGRLKGKEKEKMLSHLVRCESCRDLLIVPKKKRTIRKRIGHTSIKIANLVAAVAASFLLFIFIAFPEHEKTQLGIVDLSTIFNNTRYKAPTDSDMNSQKIDADAYLKEILEITDMSDVEAYQKARAMEENGDLIQARREYKRAYIAIRHNQNADERIRQKIVINYRLLQLSQNEQKKNNAGINAYKSMLRYDIAVYATRYKEP